MNEKIADLYAKIRDLKKETDSAWGEIDDYRKQCPHEKYPVFTVSDVTTSTDYCSDCGAMLARR